MDLMETLINALCDLAIEFHSEHTQNIVGELTLPQDRMRTLWAKLSVKVYE